METTELEKERGYYLGGGVVCEEDDNKVTEDTAEDWLTCAVQEDSRRRLAPEVRLLAGERMGWWSAQKFDKRASMRTLVIGSVDDSHVRILLDTGAIVSGFSEYLAKRLTLREIVGHGRCMDVQGVTKGKMLTSRRAKVKATLGWERVYAFEV
ncbi:hypothetical protein ON010_g9303 [Phytophthora cinnamomi]|nr:hypothetical protein ON010_g9303 [Phytophthora cinnamomi]